MLIIPFGSRRLVNTSVEAPPAVLRIACDGFGNLKFGNLNTSSHAVSRKSGQHSILGSCLYLSVNGPNVSPAPHTHQQYVYLVCNINSGVVLYGCCFVLVLFLWVLFLWVLFCVGVVLCGCCFVWVLFCVGVVLYGCCFV